jgi:hypothetical protein
MATSTVTWNWASGLESWTFTADVGPYWAGSHDNTDGDGDSGSLTARIATKNKSATAYWTRSASWSAFFTEVTDSDNVTLVRRLALSTKATQYQFVAEGRYSDTSGSNANGLWTDALASGNELWAGRSVAGVEPSWSTHGAGTNQSVASGSQAGSTTVEFRLYVFGDLDNTAGAELDLNHDALQIEVTYSGARIPRSASMCPILGG